MERLSIIQVVSTALCCLLWLSGCATPQQMPEPMGKAHFDQTFSRTIEPEEKLVSHAESKVTLSRPIK